jgi:hypothetical protein
MFEGYVKWQFVGNMVFMLNIYNHIIGNIRNKESWKIEQWWMSMLGDFLCMTLIFKILEWIWRWST